MSCARSGGDALWPTSRHVGTQFIASARCTLRFAWVVTHIIPRYLYLYITPWIVIYKTLQRPNETYAPWVLQTVFTIYPYRLKWDRFLTCEWNDGWYLISIVWLMNVGEHAHSHTHTANRENSAVKNYSVTESTKTKTPRGAKSS